jgi:hypothetical protein
MMTREDRQEALSLAYIHAVAAMCGMTHSVPSKDYGIDISLHEVDRRVEHFYQTGWQLDFQVKSTTSIAETRTAISYDLSRKGYDDLRFPTDRCRVLAVSVLPADESRWLRQTRLKLELQQRVYWISLRDFPAVRNRSSVRVTIPKRQLFTVASLRWIMDRIRAGESLS